VLRYLEWSRKVYNDCSVVVDPENHVVPLRNCIILSFIDLFHLRNCIIIALLALSVLILFRKEMIMH
jgi:hypothetical protein